jgi:hypothetical protein
MTKKKEGNPMKQLGRAVIAFLLLVGAAIPQTLSDVYRSQG